MKNNYTFKNLITLLICVLFALQTEAQVRILKVNPAAKTVTIKNFNAPGSPIDISGWWLCNFPDYATIGSQSTDGSTLLDNGDSVTVTITSASFDMNIGDDEMGLYNQTNTSFGLPDAMEDYMQWGSAGHVRESVAVSAGIWIFDEFVNVTPPYQFNGDGGDIGSAFWETSLSIDDVTLNNEFTLSPNPTNSDINLQFSSSISKGNIDAHDISGRLVYTRKINNTNSETINASEWMQGIYLITVNANGKIQTKRFVKQ